MGAHLIDGTFKSDKYPSCPLGKVPLSVKDPTAQGLLWEYAQRRRVVDAEFSDDLEQALRNAGYDPEKKAQDEARDLISTLEKIDDSPAVGGCAKDSIRRLLATMNHVVSSLGMQFDIQLKPGTDPTTYLNKYKNAATAILKVIEDRHRLNLI